MRFFLVITFILLLTGCGDISLQAPTTDLRSQLLFSSAALTQAGHSIKITLPGDEDFSFDSAQLTPQADSTLNAIVNVLQHYPDMAVKVIGYTDNQGGFRGNIIESEKRARTVAAYFTHHGIPLRRIATEGRGSADPIASNNTATGRALNRRAEIYLYRTTNGDAE